MNPGFFPGFNFTPPPASYQANIGVAGPNTGGQNIQDSRGRSNHRGRGGGRGGKAGSRVQKHEGRAQAQDSGRPEKPPEVQERAQKRRDRRRAVRKERRREVLARRPDVDPQELMGILGEPTPKAAPTDDTLGLGNLRISEEQKKFPFILEELMQDLAQTPGHLDTSVPAVKMVVDDMAWALVKFGSAELRDRLTSCSHQEGISILEKALEEALFRKERRNRHSLPDDEDTIMGNC